MTTQILLFDQPRAGGHLVERVLGNVDRTLRIENIHGPARGIQIQWLSSPSHENGMSNEDRSAFDAAIETSTQKWRDTLTQCQSENTTMIINTHSFSTASPETVLRYIAMTEGSIPLPSSGENFTEIPDNLLLLPGTVPIMTIREPSVTVASAYRVLKSFDLPLAGNRNSFLVTTSLVWTRVLYDFYIANGIRPLVVDADDVMTSEAYVRYMTEQAGLRPEDAIVSWPAITAEEKANIHPMQWLSQKGLYQSTGLDGSRAANNIDEKRERETWPEEFGEHLTVVEEMINLAMPHYRYLHERRLKLRGTAV